MKKFLAILSMFFLLGSQSSIALGQTRIFRGGAPAVTPVEGTTAEGAAVLPKPILIGGDDGTDITNILVDTDGHLQVDVLGGAFPSFAEDSPAIDLSLGSYPLTVRQDVDGSSSADTDGDNAFLFSDSRGFLKTEIFTGGDTFAISAASLPLPAGAATSALQTTGNTSLASLAGALVVEDDPNVSGAEVFPISGVRNDLQGVLCGTDGDNCPIMTFSDGSLSVRSAFSALFLAELRGTATAGNPAKLEDGAATTTDAGMGALGVVNITTSIKASDGDYTFPALARSGANLAVPIFEGTITSTFRATNREDLPSADSDAGILSLRQRDDLLEAGAGVDADGDFTYARVNNFGAAYQVPHNPISELAITELIGINEQVDASEYGASVATTLSGTGEILNICLFTTEDGTGAVRTPSGTLLLFNADPATTAGDTDITAVERITVLAHFSLLSTDYQFDANGASNCQATTEVYNTGTLFAAFFLAAGEVSFNDVAGDDEQLELSVLFRRDS